MRSGRVPDSPSTPARRSSVGGRWRVYGTRVAGVGDGTVEAVLGRRLAEGLETRRED